MNTKQKQNLLKRINECVTQPCEIYSEHEKALYVLADCREALSKEYVPMTDAERNKWLSSEWSNSVMLEKFELEIVKRLGIKVKMNNKLTYGEN